MSNDLEIGEKVDNLVKSLTMTPTSYYKDVLSIKSTFNLLESWKESKKITLYKYEYYVMRLSERVHKTIEGIRVEQNSKNNLTSLKQDLEGIRNNLSIAKIDEGKRILIKLLLDHRFYSETECFYILGKEFVNNEEWLIFRNNQVSELLRICNQIELEKRIVFDDLINSYRKRYDFFEQLISLITKNELGQFFLKINEQLVRIDESLALEKKDSKRKQLKLFKTKMLFLSVKCNEDYRGLTSGLLSLNSYLMNYPDFINSIFLEIEQYIFEYGDFLFKEYS